MARTEAQPLRQYVGSAERFLFDRNACVRIGDLAGGTALGGRLEALAGKSVLLATGSQLTTALALIELDGIARRLAILPPDADPDHFAAIVAGADIDAVVVDPSSAASDAFDLPVRVACTATIAATERLPAPSRQTEWVMLTSGTTGVPKMVVHTLSGLTAAFRGRPIDDSVVWGTFYDIRRYGGLQIFLRTVLGGVSLALVQRRRADGRSSRPPRPPRRHSYVGHADALAPRADVACHPQYLAALRPAVRGNRRPGHSRQSAPCLSVGGRQSCLCLDRSRRGVRSP